jgi:hypothetical protein
VREISYTNPVYAEYFADPFVWKVGGTGDRWENDSYGVDYGVAEAPMGPYADMALASGARVLRTAPGSALGPGHNSVVVGAGRQD